MMSMYKYSILFISKNDYSLLENWLLSEFKADFPTIINLDIGSNNEELSRGKELCERYNIEFLISKRTEMQLNLQEVILYSKLLLESDFILYLHTDCFKIDQNVYTKINELIKQNNLHKFGCIGFNIYHDDEIKQISPDNILMTTARGVLQKGNGYYNSKSLLDLNKFKSSAFAVESIMWCAALLSKKTYSETIKPDENFNFFHAFDDIAYQFMTNGIYNIVIPTIRLKHDQGIKEKFGYNKKSPLGKKSDVKKKYGRIDHHQIWYEKYGFHWDLRKIWLVPSITIVYKIIAKLLMNLNRRFYLNLNTVARREFKKSNSAKYPILMEFYNSNKPLKLKVSNKVKVPEFQRNS